MTGLQVNPGATLAGAGDVQGSAQVNGTVVAAGQRTDAGQRQRARHVLDHGRRDAGRRRPERRDGELRRQWHAALNTSALGTALVVGADGGTIDFVNQPAGNPAFVDGALTVDVGTTTMTMELAGTPPPGLPSIVSDGAGGTDLVLACFAAGTRLAASAGSVAVELVRVGHD